MSMDPTDTATAVDEVLTATVDQPRTTALATPHRLTDLERAELAWVRDHPEGRRDLLEEGRRLVLWNYDVGSDTLKPEHIQALQRLTQPLLLADRDTINFIVQGAASVSGTAAENERLSQRRADRVAAWLQTLGFLDINATGLGATDETGRLDGETLARSRRTELARYESQRPPPRRPAPPFPPPWTPPPKPAQEPRTDVPLPKGRTEWKWSGPIGPPFELEYLVGQVSGEVTARLVSEDPGWGAQVSVGGASQQVKGTWQRRVSGDVKAKVTDWLSMKLALKQPGAGKDGSWATRAGVQFDKVFLKPEVGVNISGTPYIFYATGTFGPVGPVRLALPIGEIDFEIEVKIRIDFTPSPALVEELGLTGGEIVAAVIITIALTYLIASIIATENERAIAQASLIAARHGFASRVAFEILDLTESVERDTKASIQRLWALDPLVAKAARGAYDDADRQLTQLKAAGTLDVRVTELKSKYSTDSTFDVVISKIVDALGGISEEGTGQFSLSQL